MKQYTTPEQTAKLIELGFVPTGRIKEVRTVHPKVEVYHDCNFTIGELIEMLPMDINNDGRFEDLIIHPNFHRWVVKYSGFIIEPTYQSCMKELVDALFAIVVKLKEEGVICCTTTQMRYDKTEQSATSSSLSKS